MQIRNKHCKIMLDFLGNIFRGNYKVDGFSSEKDGNVGKRTIDDNTLRYI